MQVWASKWSERAWLSRKARGVPDASLYMAVLLQQAGADPMHHLLLLISTLIWLQTSSIAVIACALSSANTSPGPVAG